MPRQKTTPAPAAMDRAAAWLESYEAAPGEDAEDIAAVAAWLRGKAADADIRAQCRAAGVSAADARRAVVNAQQ
jgi:hypothetical protein